MVFSSNLFLFVFLPFVVFFHTVAPVKTRNLFLLVASLAFYAWGSGPVIFLLLVSIAVNFLAGIGISKYPLFAKVIFGFTTAFNLLLLLYYKYFGFLYSQIHELFAGWSIMLPEPVGIPLPIGISFFTFQAISYLGEIYRKEQRPATNPIEYGMYIALFPHLIAGPIVRYSDICREITSRHIDVAGLYDGLWRFCLGLGKKVLIANTVGAVADSIFAVPAHQLTTADAWVGAVCYAFQIYYDFSGYSDMAIGLAAMLGFRFPENFNQPYRSASVTEFWRRWHMSLSRWFRDFVYIPMGGNQKGALRTYFNLWTVFVLCGLWHGAAWNFLIWGVFHGTLLIAERLLKNVCGFTIEGVAGHIYTMLAVTIGWIFFRASDFSEARDFLMVMSGTARSTAPIVPALPYLSAEVITALVAGMFFCLDAFRTVEIEQRTRTCRDLS